MEADSITIREHTNAAIPFTLYSNDVVIDLSSSHHVEFNMVDNKRKTYQYSSLDSPAHVILSSSTLGYITYNPPTTLIFTYDRSPYKAYCWVFDTSGVKYSVPRDGYCNITVLREY
jgi:hypothetical protein